MRFHPQFESDFPETTIRQEVDSHVIEINQHIYTKLWWHKSHAMVFAEAGGTVYEALRCALKESPALTLTQTNRTRI
jgi:hypothetical protein